jgi:hypothetical protein
MRGSATIRRMAGWRWVRWVVAVLCTMGIAVPVAGATILRGDAVFFFLGYVLISTVPVFLYVFLIRTRAISVALGVVFIGLNVLLPIGGYQESFVTGAGAGGWLLWVDTLIGLPLLWLSFLVGWAVDATTSRRDRRDFVAAR